MKSRPNRRTPEGKLTRTYRKWSSMIQRCYNPKHGAFRYYGGSGITVCDSWRHSFDAFLADMGEAPEAYWIDRISNEVGYQPGNCRWVSTSESAANRRKTGPKLDPNSLRQRALAAGLPYAVVYQRIFVHRWPEERALSTPKLTKGRQVGARMENGYLSRSEKPLYRHEDYVQSP